MISRFLVTQLGAIAALCGSLCCASDLEKVVVETSRKAELTPYAADLARELRKPLVYAETASPRAFNLGGAAFAAKMTGVELPAKLPADNWQWLGETPDGGVVAAGEDTFSIIHAALEMQDHLRWGHSSGEKFSGADLPQIRQRVRRLCTRIQSDGRSFRP